MTANSNSHRSSRNGVRIGGTASVRCGLQYADALLGAYAQNIEDANLAQCRGKTSSSSYLPPILVAILSLLRSML